MLENKIWLREGYNQATKTQNAESSGMNVAPVETGWLEKTWTKSQDILTFAS